MKPISIYIHIPFCIKKCNYCDFLSAPADNRTQEEYLHALNQEIIIHAPYYLAYEVQTIFIGGGTPTVVPAEGICKVLDIIREYYHVSTEAEISMEANPGTVSKESLRLYKNAGINRLSFGLQSADNKELKCLGRIHTYEDFLSTYQMAVDTGFTNLNVDLMSALPGQIPADYQNTLRKIVCLSPKPTHISAYSLIIEEGTPFYILYGEESKALEHTGEPQAHLPSEDEERAMYQSTEDILHGAGYHRYEISNYSLPGYECRHNEVYWRRGNYVGFGLGASSMVENLRFQNNTDLDLYIIEPGKIKEQEQLSQKDQMSEFMFLGLRLIEGVNKEDFFGYFGVSMDEIYGKVLEKNREEGLLVNGHTVTLTTRGLDMSNYVMAQFLL
ncbi:MAG TPA: radical SAM family heme chaperone HemW [Lachnospiraceae bacterium]|nr:radical SAM family heme chaperone HemW [Lachnospiraceae bacterium]